jgi:hypothetical protein
MNEILPINLIDRNKKKKYLRINIIVIKTINYYRLRQLNKVFL